jgi:hypothetical protein
VGTVTPQPTLIMLSDASVEQRQQQWRAAQRRVDDWLTDASNSSHSARAKQLLDLLLYAAPSWTDTMFFKDITPADVRVVLYASASHMAALFFDWLPRFGHDLTDASESAIATLLMFGADRDSQTEQIGAAVNEAIRLVDWLLVEQRGGHHVGDRVHVIQVANVGMEGTVESPIWAHTYQPEYPGKRGARNEAGELVAIAPGEPYLYNVRLDSGEPAMVNAWNLAPAGSELTAYSGRALRNAYRAKVARADDAAEMLGTLMDSGASEPGDIHSAIEAEKQAIPLAHLLRELAPTTPDMIENWPGGYVIRVDASNSLMASIARSFAAGRGGKQTPGDEPHFELIGPAAGQAWHTAAEAERHARDEHVAGEVVWMPFLPRAGNLVVLLDDEHWASEARRP